MRGKNVFMLGLVCALVCNGCSKKEGSVNQSGFSDLAYAKTTVADKKNIDDEKNENDANTTEVIGKIELKRPADWVKVNDGYYKNGRVQFYMMVFEDYNKKKLMKDFGYEDEKTCLQHYIGAMGHDVTADEGIEYTEQKLIFPSYRFMLTGDKFYPNGNGKAVDNQEPFILQAMVDKDNKTLYMFYFFDEMADEEKADGFLSNLQLFDETDFYDDSFGLYRWQNGAEIYQ